MPKFFVLDVETQPKENTAIFKLSDEQGKVLAPAHQVHVTDENSFYWAALFNTSEYVNRYAGNLRPDPKSDPLTAEDIIVQLGVFLGNKVFGKDIITQLHQEIERRTLFIRLPDTRHDRLAADLARVPWEIARSPVDKEPLLARNLAVRAISAADLPEDNEILLELADGEELRVLLIFAESPDSRPLAARLEHERLLALFYDDILPNRLVQIDMLCYGVTRTVIEERVTKAGGYHIVHWSGHGYHNTLELLGEDGQQDNLHGEELLELLKKAGGFIPKLVFLGACHSGSSINKKDYTSTALALLGAGVPQVIAMRYEVSDVYARELALLFYKHLLTEPHSTEKALALARNKLANDTTIPAIDHTTPLLFGRDHLVMKAHNKSNSAQLKKRYPRPSLQHALKRPDHFVGRGKELTRLNCEWLPRHKPAVALLQGLAGLGKTALAAETLHLWHDRFDWVLAVQARPDPLTAETFYQEIDQRLRVASKEYRATCKEDEYRKLWLPQDEITGAERYQTMRDNFINALYDERILLIIDNFDTNLLPNSQGCQDPEWQNLLEDFCTRLSDSGSRVLITSRHCPAVLKNRAVWLPLGPLPLNEAYLFWQSHKDLGQLWNNKATRDIARRVVEISHGHPLIMQHLGKLAHVHEAKELAAILNAIEQEGFKQHLPDLVTDEEREAECRYLEEVAIGAVDKLIEWLSPDARQLLWVVTLALEPVPYSLFAWVWEKTAATLLKELTESGLLEQDKVEKLLKELTESGLLQQDKVKEESIYSFHELVRERCTAWMDKNPQERGEREAKQIEQTYGECYIILFEKLLKSDNIRETATEMGRRALTYLVRARAFDVLEGFASDLVNSTRHPQQLQTIIAELEPIVEQVPIGRTRWSVRAYLADALVQSNQPEEALSRYAKSKEEAEAAQDWSDVGWICHNYANALKNVAQFSQARQIYQKAAQAKRQAAQDWLDVGWICYNCTNALNNVGLWSQAGNLYQYAAQTEHKANSLEIDVLGSELETLRVDVHLGQAQQVLPEIKQLVELLQICWQSHKQGETVAAAPDAEILARTFISALDIERQAHGALAHGALEHEALEHWQDCLELLTKIEKVKKAGGESEHALARTRFNRYRPLIKLGELAKAQQVLEDCLQVFSDVGDFTGQSAVLTALAEFWDKRGELQRAIELDRQALALHERLDNPADRAISHSNLSEGLYKLWLKKKKKKKKKEESARHTLAFMVYAVATDNQQLLTEYRHDPDSAINQAAKTATPYPLPRLFELLKHSEFDALKQFLKAQKVNIEKLQAKIDEIYAIYAKMKTTAEEKPAQAVQASPFDLK